MMARRILICLHDFSRGGTERVAIGLASQWVAAGRTVSILCGSSEGGLRDAVDRHVKIIKLNPPVKRGPLSRLRLGRAMGKRLTTLRPDAIFLPGNYHAPLANGLRAGDPQVVIGLKISNPPLPQGVPFGEKLFRRATRGVSGFAAMNSGLTHQLEALLPGRDIVTLYDPVYVRPGTAKPPQARAHEILWIGRLEPQKDPLLALKTMAALGGDYFLTMLGEGSLQRKVERSIAALDLTDRVQLVGHVPEIEPYLAAADALLITSHYEGGPAVAVEALAQGVPVVGTDCSFLLQDLLRIEEAGRIVSSREPVALASALAAVCDRPHSLEALQALTAPFEPQTCAQAYLDWFDRLMADG